MEQEQITKLTLIQKINNIINFNMNPKTRKCGRRSTKKNKGREKYKKNGKFTRRGERHMKS